MKSASALVSIVINNHNYGGYLARSIESALAQTYDHVEVIVVDDGSTDQSGQVIERYSGRAIPILKENGGQGSALNAGFAASSGQYVIFLDADDALLPEAAACALARFGSDTAKVCWPLAEIDSEGRELGRLIPTRALPEGMLRDRLVSEGPNVTVEVPTSGNAWSRWFLDRVLPMPEDAFRINADAYLSTLAPVYGEIGTLDRPQSQYRIHGGNRYVLGTVEEKNRRQLDLYVLRCMLVAQHLRGIGFDVDPTAWQDGNWHYEYLKRVGTTTNEILSTVSEGESFILLDDGLWGDGRAGTPSVAGREAIPFLEREGAYYGRPVDDATAISELKRLRAERQPAFAIVVWLAFWWLDHYAGLANYLRENFPCVLANERVIVFDLRR